MYKGLIVLLIALGFSSNALAKKCKDEAYEMLDEMGIEAELHSWDKSKVGKSGLVHK